MFFSSSKNLMLVKERVLIIYPSELFSVEFSSGISTDTIINEKVTTVIKHLKSILFIIKNLYHLRVARQSFSEAGVRLEAFQELSPGGVCQNRCS